VRGRLRLGAPARKRPIRRVPPACAARTKATPVLVRGARGQATIELLALVPAFVALGLGLLQLLAVGYASVLAGGAAEAGALAVARGGDPSAAARAALPGWESTHARVDVDGGHVEVRLRPPSPLRALAERLEVRASASVEAP
jgi:Flp pilus assembly protein TadG